MGGYAKKFFRDAQIFGPPQFQIRGAALVNNVNFNFVREGGEIKVEIFIAYWL